MRGKNLRLLAALILVTLLTGCGQVYRTRTVVLDEEKRQSGQKLQTDKIYSYDFRHYSGDLSHRTPAVWGPDENSIITLSETDNGSLKVQKVDYRFGFFEDYGKLPEGIENIYSLSPGGRYMIYSTEEEGRSTLMAADLMTDKTVELISIAEVEKTFAMSEFVWSGNGQYFYFTEQDSWMAVERKGNFNGSFSIASDKENYDGAGHRVWRYDVKSGTVKLLPGLTDFYREQNDGFSEKLTVSYDGSAVLMTMLGYEGKQRVGVVELPDKDEIYQLKLPYGSELAITQTALYELIEEKEIWKLNYTREDMIEKKVVTTVEGYCQGMQLLPDKKGAVVQLNTDKGNQVVYYEEGKDGFKNGKLLYQYTDKQPVMAVNPSGTGVMLLNVGYVDSYMGYVNDSEECKTTILLF